MVARGRDVPTRIAPHTTTSKPGLPNLDQIFTFHINKVGPMHALETHHVSIVDLG